QQHYHRKHCEPEICDDCSDRSGMDCETDGIRSREIHVRLVEESWERSEQVRIACPGSGPGLDGASQPARLDQRDREDHAHYSRQIEEPERKPPTRKKKEEHDRQQTRKP